MRVALQTLVFHRLLSAGIGFSVGVLASPMLVWAVSMMSAEMSDGAILSVSALVCALFLPSFIAVRVTGNSVDAVAAQLGQGIAFALFTPYALDGLLSCLLIGVIVMIAFWLTRRYRDRPNTRLLVMAVGVGALAFLLNIIGHQFVLAGWMMVALGAVSIGGALLAAWVADQIARFVLRFSHTPVREVSG